MKKKSFLLGMSVLLLLGSVLPATANTESKEAVRNCVSANALSQNSVETVTQKFTGYIDKEPYWKFGSSGEEVLDKSGETPLPATYDSRKYGYVTDAKSQGGFGTCWAFAMMAAVESSLIKHGLADQKVDLSEYHLAYFSYTQNVDPLGNTEGDYYVPENTLVGKLARGGHVQDAIEQLAKWCGPVEEKTLPYSDAQNLIEPDQKLAFQSGYHLKNAFYADCRNREDVKKLVYEHGAATIGYHADGSYLAEFQGDSTYYVPDVTVASHAVCIVGWDDNFPKEQFKYTPPGDGAWLCKDSDTMNGNYIWVSYYTPISSVAAVEMEAAELLDNNYQYDGCIAGTSAYSDIVGENNQAVSFMNLFEAKVSEKYLEELEAVSIHVNGNETYSVTVYVNPVISSAGKITDYAYKSAPVTCAAGEYAGIRKVEMKEPIYLNEGDWFCVEVSGDDMENYAVSTSLEHGYEAMNHGECFVGVKEKDGITYRDLANELYQVTPRIKAFTKCTEIPCATGLLLDTEKINLTAGESCKIQASVIVPAGGLTGVTFYSSDPEIASVAANGEVTAHTSGTCQITVQCTYGNVSKTCEVQVKNVLANSLETENYVNLTQGEKYLLTSILDAKATIRSLEYESENPAVARVNEAGQIEAVSPGETKIIVKTTDGSQLTAVCQVKVASKKVVTEAIYLSIGEPAILVGQSTRLSVSRYPGTVDDNRVTFLVSDPTVVSVEGDLVKGLAPGTACITVKAQDSGAMASVTIYVYGEKNAEIAENGNGNGNTDGNGTNMVENPKQEILLGKIFKYKNIKYQISSENTVTVTGATKKTIKTLTIPNTVKYKGKKYFVTKVSDKAFYCYKKLTTVKVGKNVKVIGKSAFYGCKNLKKVTITSSKITKVGKHALRKTNADLTMKVPKKKLSFYKKLFKNAGLGKKVQWKKK